MPAGHGWPFRDFPGMLDYFTSTVNDLFMDWLMLPDPGRFQGAVDQVYAASKTLALDARIHPKPGDGGWGPTASSPATSTCSTTRSRRSAPPPTSTTRRAC
jgi:hypothetical protein